MLYNRPQLRHCVVSLLCSRIDCFNFFFCFVFHSTDSPTGANATSTSSSACTRSTAATTSTTSQRRLRAKLRMKFWNIPKFSGNVARSCRMLIASWHKSRKEKQRSRDAPSSEKLWMLKLPDTGLHSIRYQLFIGLYEQ